MNIIHQHLALNKLGQKVDWRIDLEALKGTGQTFGQTWEVAFFRFISWHQIWETIKFIFYQKTTDLHQELRLNSVESKYEQPGDCIQLTSSDSSSWHHLTLRWSWHHLTRLITGVGKRSTQTRAHPGPTRDENGFFVQGKGVPAVGEEGCGWGDNYHLQQ